MRRRFLILALVALLLLACRFVPGMAATFTDGFSRPIMALLHRLTAPIPFPVAEVLAIVLASIFTFSILTALGSLSALLRRLRGIGRTALALAVALALLWVPPLCLPGEPIAAPNAEQLAWLCDSLIDALSASPLAFPDAADALRRAPAVAGHPSVAVKASRYPEWMDACRVWGLFVPLTGEAIVDADTPAPLLPFTAVHELMHLDGVAGEGAANVAAWERCLDAGGAFADSARLWALRYAMGLLQGADPDAWRQMGAKMEGPLRRTFLQCGGEADPAAGPRASARGDYAALAAYLASNIAPKMK